MFKLPHNCTHLTSKVMLKILQARLQQYMNHEIPDVQAGFRKGRRTRDQIANIHWIIEKAGRVPEKHLFLLYWLHQSLWLCESQQTVENSLRDRSNRPPDLSNLYAEYIMWNARVDEAQARIKIARRNINNLRYADDTTLMAESEEELKSLLMKVKEENENIGLKLNIQKMKIMASGPITS